jgi:hypothetical protein
MGTMILPRYSMRRLLAVMAIFALMFTVVGMAVRGHGWAVVPSLAMAAAAVLLVVQSAMMALVWLVSATQRKLKRSRARRAAAIETPAAEMPS